MKPALISHFVPHAAVGRYATGQTLGLRVRGAYGTVNGCRNAALPYYWHCSPLPIGIAHVCSRRFQFTAPTSVPIHDLRNIGIFAHIDAGKTSTTECLLYNSREIAHIGSVLDGTTQMDFLPQERERGITIQSAVTTFYWKNHQVNVIDTPGHVDFSEEVSRAVSVLDGAVIVLDGVNGVEAQTETIWRQLDNGASLPRLIFTNKLDREGVSLEQCLSMVQSRLHTQPLLLQYFLGRISRPSSQIMMKFVSLIDMKLYTYTINKRGKLMAKVSVEEGSAALEYFKQSNQMELVKKERDKLLEAIADLDDAFAEALLEGEIVDTVLLWNALRRITLSRRGIPMLCGSAVENVAIDLLMDAIVMLLPSPLEKPSYKIKEGDKDVCEKYFKLIKTQKELFFNTSQPKSSPHANSLPCVNANDEIISSDVVSACCLPFKVLSDKRGGRIVFCRALSGDIRPQMRLFNATKGVIETISGIFRVKADRYTKIPSVRSGDIAMLQGLKHTVAGDTLYSCNLASKVQPFVLCLPNKLASPVCFRSFVPLAPKDDENLLHALQEISWTDLSLQLHVDRDLEQILVWGLGELHLEIVRDRLSTDYGLQVQLGDMEIGYKEYIEDCCGTYYHHQMIVNGLASSMGMRMNFTSLPLPPEEEQCGREWLDATSSNYDCKIVISKQVYQLIERSNMSNKGSTPAFVTPTKLADIILAIEQTLSDSLKNGPLIGAPLLNLQVTIEDLKVDMQTPLALVKSCTVQIFQKLLLESSATLLEPMMQLSVSCEEQNVGVLTNDLTNKRKARLQSIYAPTHTDLHKRMTIEATYMDSYDDLLSLLVENSICFTLNMELHVVPLKSMIGYSSIFNSLTHGTASFQMRNCGFAQVSDGEMEDILFKRGRLHYNTLKASSKN